MPIMALSSRSAHLFSVHYVQSASAAGDVGDVQFFIFGITGEANHFHTSSSGAGMFMEFDVATNITSLGRNPLPGSGR